LPPPEAAPDDRSIVQNIPDRVTVKVGREPAVLRPDLADIRRAGVLRVLVHRGAASSLDRTGSPLDRELAIVEIFAGSLSIPVRFVNVESHGHLIPALLAGKGEIIASRLTKTSERGESVRFTSPIRYVGELVIAPAHAAATVSSPADLAGKEVWIGSTSSFAEHLRALHLVPPPVIRSVENGIDSHTILSRVGSGAYPLAIADSDVIESYQSYRDDVQVVATLRDDSAIAWAVRPTATELLAAIDDFIAYNVEIHRGPDVFMGDLDEIKKRGILRVAMSNNSQSYFFFRGAPYGHQYSLAQRLAKRLGVRLEVVIAREQRDLIPLLLRGRADLVAARLTVTPDREKVVDFTAPLTRVDEYLVQRSDEPPITSVDQLAGREIHVRRQSAYWQTLTALHATVPDLKIVAVDAQLETEQLIEMVAAGAIPLTIADYDIVHVGLTPRDDIRANLVVARGRDRAYAVRPGSPSLKAAVDNFVRAERGNAPPTYGARTPEQPPPTPPGSFSPFDHLAKKYATRFQLDWKLILALMDAESGFVPEHEGWIGAQGLMGVMPHTLRALGLDVDLNDPDGAVHAGALRLRRIMDGLEPGLDPAERRQFAIAAYHAGFEHLADARTLAREQNLDDSRWAENVERAILLKVNPSHAGSTRFGYCMAADTIDYVARVEAIYQGYSGGEPK
jgi:membrane-bound lytic murein transglycosylase F